MTHASSSQPPPLPPGRGAAEDLAPPAPTAPRLNDFWPRAQALMALEHGLTPACQVKLATLAQELRLTDDEYQAALAMLRGRAEPEAPPSAGELRAAQFREYVEKKIAKLATPMLDASRESRWLAAADEKFSLDAATARKVIESLAAERGVRRVTRDEASAMVEQMVAEKVDDAVWLDHAAAQRLIVAGQVWGLSAQEVEDLIGLRTATNRERLAAERRRATLLVVGAVGATLCVAGGIAWLLWTRGGGERAPEQGVATTAGTEAGPGENSASEPSGTERSKEGTTAGSPQRVAPPAWWDGRLAVAVAQARTWFRSFRPVHELLASSRGDERGAGYEKLVAWSQEIPQEETERSPASLARDILIMAYVGEPDDAAAKRLAEGLVAPLADVSRRTPRQVADVHRAIWAVETAVQAATWPELAAPRGDQLLGSVARALDVEANMSTTAAELRRVWHGALARVVLRRAADLAATDPAMALDLHDAVRDAANQLPPEDFRRLQSTLLAVALPVAGEQWNSWRHVLQEALSTRDPLLLVPIIELYERGGSSPWREPLGELLRTRAGTTNETKDPTELARAVRESLGLAAATVKTLPLDVWKQLKAPAEAALARAREDGDEEEWLRRGVELSYWGTLAAAAAHGDAGRHVWEQAWREGEPKRAEVVPPRRERTGVFGAPDVPPMRPAESARIANVRRTQVQRLAGALEHFDRLEPLQRLNNLRGLALLVGEAPDVTPSQGQNIARYLLSNRPDPEGREMREPGRIVVVWPQVKLGLADHLSTSKLDPAAMAELVGQALGRTVAAEEAERGRENLRRELIAQVLDGLSGASLAPDRQLALAARAEETATEITNQYARRSALWAFEPATVAEPSPGTLVAALTRHLATRMASTGTPREREAAADFAWQAAVADYQGVTDLHRLVAWERLFVRLVALEVARLHPAQAADAIALVTRELDGRRATGSLLAQYVRLEALQLELWMLAARASGSRT